jgi:wyosine [tRNA(Phe)-imidazoG37] synthetase (radical SAM superfamily)
MSIIYGPVPSWRLGRSLGIDLISAKGKTCTFDCVYCQLGRTTTLTAERRVWVEMSMLQAELEALPSLELDFVTFSGTGEPTLAANLGEALDLVRLSNSIRGTPTAVLTNSSLLPRPDVRRDLAKADLVVVKVDAPDELCFEAINRSNASYSWGETLQGIRVFRQEYAGTLALQMMFMAANKKRAAAMAAIARSLAPDEVQLNTPLRPNPVPHLSKLEMAAIEQVFAGLPVVNVYTARPPTVRPLDVQQVQRRRPGREQISDLR